MSYFKNNKLKVLNILLAIFLYIVIWVNYSRITVQIHFNSATTANCFVGYTTKKFFTNKTIKSVKIENKQEAKTFLPQNTKKIIIYIDSKNPYNIDFVKIGGNKILLNIAIHDTKRNPIINLPTSIKLIKIFQNQVRNIMFTMFLLLIFYIALLMNKELNYLYTKAKEYASERNYNNISKKFKYLLLAVLIFLFSFNFFSNIVLNPGVGLDNSWVYGINKINTLPQYLYGRDVVFTYGPLGFLLYPLAMGSNLYLGLFFNLVKEIVLISILAFNIFKVNKKFFLGKFILLFLGIFIFYTPAGDWIYALLFIFLILTLWFYEQKNKLFVTILACLIGFFSILIFFMKFNTGILAIILSVIIGLLLLIYERKYFLNFIFSYLVTFVTSFTVLFNLYFKSFHNFIDWIIGSISVSQGFNANMTVQGPISFTILAISIMLFYLVIVYNFYKQDFKMFIGSLLLAPFIFFAFKHGFVRQDGHMGSFFYTIPFLIGFLSIYIKKEDYKKFLKIYLIIIICCIIYPININHTRTLPNPLEQILNIQKINVSNSSRNIYSQKVLPTKWRNEIQDQSIQILPLELSYAEANNLKGWQPNPTLQLYSAYTEYLDSLSAKSFVKTEAPQYILLEFSAIDRRNMFLDNPATWNNIMANYSICLQDNEKLLLKKNASKILSKKFKLISTQNTKLNGWIKLPSSSGKDYLYAQFDIKNNLLGNIVTLLFRGYPLDIEIKYKNGKIFRHRIIVGNLKTPVIVNYIPQNISEFGQLIKHKKPDSIEVDKIRFIEPTKLLYYNEVSINWLKNDN